MHGCNTITESQSTPWWLQRAPFNWLLCLDSAHNDFAHGEECHGAWAGSHSYALSEDAYEKDNRHDMIYDDLSLPPPRTTHAATCHSRSNKSFGSRSWLSSILQRDTDVTAERPVIGLPTNFQHLNGSSTEALGALRIPSPVMLPSGRLSPLPDFEKLREEDIPELMCASILIVQSINSTRRSGLCAIPRKPLCARSMGDLADRALAYAEEESADHPQTRAGFLGANDEEGSEQWEHTQSTRVDRGRRRSKTAPTRIIRHLHTPSFGRNRPAVEEAVRELQTIVEELRDDSKKKQEQERQNRQRSLTLARTPSRWHTPAIAPTMKMRVGSDLLQDIGSAFSRPLSGDKSSEVSMRTPRHETGQQGMARPHAKTMPSTSFSLRLSDWLNPSTFFNNSISREALLDTPQHMTAKTCDGGQRSSHDSFSTFTTSSTATTMTGKRHSTASSASNSTISTSRFPIAPLNISPRKPKPERSHSSATRTAAAPATPRTRSTSAPGPVASGTPGPANGSSPATPSLASSNTASPEHGNPEDEQEIKPPVPPKLTTTTTTTTTTTAKISPVHASITAVSTTTTTPTTHVKARRTVRAQAAGATGYRVRGGHGYGIGVAT